jgi:hypothetical protein
MDGDDPRLDELEAAVAEMQAIVDRLIALLQAQRAA